MGLIEAALRPQQELNSAEMSLPPYRHRHASGALSECNR
jgi:hypothetical protein